MEREGAAPRAKAGEKFKEIGMGKMTSKYIEVETLVLAQWNYMQCVSLESPFA